MQVIPHEQTLELYHYQESLCSQMVRIALSEKGCDWTSRVIGLEEVVFEGDNLSEAYLSINPKGQVPTLVHEGVPVYDSYEIIRYLDRIYPGQGVRLIPEDPRIDAQVKAWVLQSSLRDDAKFGKSLGMAIPVFSAPLIKACINRQPVAHVVRKFRRHPVLSRRVNFVMLRALPFIPKVVFRDSVTTVARALVSIEQTLAESGGPWLLGEYTQADVMMMAHFHRLEDVSLGAILQWDRLPHVKEYWRRLQARPSYQMAVTDWHEENWRWAIREVFGSEDSPRLTPLKRRVAKLL
jgi:glutathione S-transferase